MKKRIGKLRAILGSRGGETLMEGIVSLLIFAILIAAVTMMLNLSMQITGASNSSAESEQEAANKALLGEEWAGTATLWLTGDGLDVPITVNITGGDYIAFAP